MTYYDFKKEKIEEICKKELKFTLEYGGLRAYDMKEEDFNLKDYSKEEYKDFLEKVYEEEKSQKEDGAYQIMCILEKYNLENYGIAYLVIKQAIFRALDGCEFHDIQFFSLGFYLWNNFNKIIQIENQTAF